MSDADPAALRQAKERYKIPHVTTDYRELLADPQVEGVNICTPNATHYEITRAALEAGKHVLVEKPIALRSEEGKALVALAAERNLALSVGHIFRFNNALTEVKRLVDQTFFGRIFLLELTWVNLEPLYPDRDVLIDLAPHAFDIMNYLLGTWPVEVSCVGSAFRRAEGEESAYLTCRFPDGILAHATLSWLVPRKTRVVSVIGENRTAHIDAVGQEVTVHESGYTYRLHVERNNTIHDELLHFLESVGDPLIETRNSGEVGVRTIELIEAAKRSMAEGRVISLRSS